MSIKEKFIKNTSYISIAKIFENIFAYLIIILITRHLGAEGLGQYSFIFSFVGLFFIFSDLGLTPLMVKDLSKDLSQINKYASNVLTTKFIITSISLVIYFISLLFIGKKDLLLPLFLVGFIELSNKLLSFSKSILKVKQNGKIIASLNLGERLLALIGASIVLPLTGNLFWFIIVLLISYSIKSIFSLLYVKKYFNFRFEINWKFIWKLVKKSYPFMLIGIFSLVYIRIDTVFLSFIQNDKVVGWYNSGYKIIKVLNIIPLLLLTFGFPLFSKFHKENKKLLKKLFEKIIQFSLLIIFPTIIGVFYIGDRILKFVYDFKTTEGVIAFKILIIAELFIYLTTIMGRLISAADRQNIFMKIAGIGALFNILLNIFLIPEYSLYGAGFATVLTYFLMFTIMYFYIKKKVLNFSFFKYLILPAVSTGIMWLVIANILHMPIGFIIILCFSIYFIPIVIYFIIFGEALSTIKKFIGQE